MNRTCENCSRPLLDTDTICWHCGQQQTLPVKAESPSEQEEHEPAEKEKHELEIETVSSPLILYYGGLTAVVVFALLLITRSLGQSPALSVKAGSSPSEWITLNAPDKSFTIEIPAKWDWQFLLGKAKEPALVEGEGLITTAVAPFGDLVPDIDYLLHAENEGSLLVIARSARLSRLSAQQVVTALQGESFENMAVTEARLTGSVPGEERAFFTLTHSDLSLHCDQYFVPGSADSYLVAVCSPMDSAESGREIRRTVLDSFTLHAR